MGMREAWICGHTLFFSLIVGQRRSCVWLFGIQWTAARQTSLSFTISLSLLKLKSTESMMPSNHLSLYGPFPFLPSIFPGIRVFAMSWFFASGGQTYEILHSTGSYGASLLAQMVKNLPATWEKRAQSLGQEDPLEKGMATHSGILACQCSSPSCWSFWKSRRV